ncbi:hypothetical protein LJC46_02195 [Desulfovibrio sp. OttesenSCG-928-G15]|nr:hypothetical protein [Desulfovibrio sp. OttesenSCG-928-G15]
MSDQDFKDRVLRELGEIKGVMTERCRSREADIAGLKKQCDRLGERMGKQEAREHRRAGGVNVLAAVCGFVGAGALTALKWIVASTGGAQ